ncbi:hypothetical protein CL642_01285 [bacterium]|nr:hypothetical protein [bacterium]|tara:strand:- start:435 stop:833 length:399 start_codon:yes stop_codon:yes gene_type:complete
MSENYVKYKTNIEWYHMKDLMYLTLYNCLVAFLPKLKDAPFPGFPVVSKKYAESVGAIYFEDEEELPVLDQFSDHGIPVNAIPVKEPEGTVFVEMVPTIERLIRECPVNSEDPSDWDRWWDRANWVVRHLWD